MPDVNATYEAPTSRKVQRNVAAAAITADLNTDLYQVEADGFIDGVSYIPIATITGAATNNRTLSLVDKKADGTGTVVLATLAFGSGVNATADVAKAITLSAVAGALAVAAGDVLQWQSLHILTGIVDPGGLVVLTVGRT